MNLYMLRYYDAVCRAKSISKAAEALSLSRQALSKSIMVLEDELGVQLLLRRRSGISLTDAGEALFRHAQVLLADWDRAVEELDAIKHAGRGTLRVGYGQMTYNTWASDHVDVFRRAHPEMEVSYEVLLPDTLIQGLQDGRFDLIVSSARADPAHFSSALLLKRPTYVICREDGPLAQRPDIRMEDLAGRTIFLIAGYSDFSKRLQEAFQAEGIEAEFRISPSSDPYTVLRLVRDSHGFYFTAALQAFYSAAMEGLSARPFVYEGKYPFPTRDICATVLRQNAVSPAAEAYIRFLRAEASRCHTPGGK